MNKILLLLFGFFISNVVLSQVDYIDFKQKYSLNCGPADSAGLIALQRQLDSLNNFEINRGEESFLYDYGMVYYQRIMRWQKPEDFEMAAELFEKGWNKYGDINAAWNLGVIYLFSGNCDGCLEFTERYLDAIPDTLEVDYEEIYLRYKYCCTRE